MARILVSASLTALLLLTPLTQAAAGYTLLEKIEEAAKIAAPENLKYRLVRDPKYKKRRVYQKLEREVAIVGLEKETGEIKKIIFTEAVLIDPQKRPPQYPPDVIAKPNGCALIWRGGSRWGFKRNLLLQCGLKDFVIIRISMPILRMERTISINKAGRRRCSEQAGKIIRASYTPYTPEIHTPELIAKGRAHMEAVINEALSQLAENKVRSHSLRDQNISEILSLDFLEMMLINEHMDHGEFRQARASGNLGKLIEKYMTEVGANGEAAHSWSVSPAGAAGIAQFICSTYARILDEYPEAQLDQKFGRAMQNHVNALKAVVVLLDADRSHWWSIKTKEICAASEENLEECWAASYNGGPSRLNLVVSKRDANWDKSGPILKKKRRYFAPSLRKETRIYLEKLRALRSYFLQAD